MLDIRPLLIIIIISSSSSSMYVCIWGFVLFYFSVCFLVPFIIAATNHNKVRPEVEQSQFGTGSEVSTLRHFTSGISQVFSIVRPSMARPATLRIGSRDPITKAKNKEFP